MYYPDEVVEEVRNKNDIVEVISGYVKIQKKEAITLDCVPSTMKSPRLFPFPPINKCIIALAAGQGGMFLLF